MWRARLSEIQSSSILRCLRAASMLASSVAAWPKMLAAQTSRIAGALSCTSCVMVPTRQVLERFFAEITSRRIRRGSYSSVDDLEAAIYDYLAHHNEKPKPFKWTKTAKDILTRERRALDKPDEIRGNR